ncbi:MAG: phosphoribosylglycinamide formyltransferase [Sphingomicrobium sp.]
MVDRQADRRRVAILISGRGSNMRALVEQADGFEIILVASNRPQAEGLDWARTRGLPTWAFDSKGMERARFDNILADALDEHRIGTVALAGYMRILTPAFIRRFAGRIVNIHPSLLPKYRGLDTHSRALDVGDRVSGCTVHAVTEEVDSGEILGQAEVAIEPGDTAQTLSERVLAAEHALYPTILKEFVAR